MGILSAVVLLQLAEMLLQVNLPLRPCGLGGFGEVIQSGLC